MAFVPDCEHDIFVSYAHVDDLPFPGTEKGWVTLLVETLRILLAQKLGRSDAFSLWMDHQLSRHEQLTPEILKHLKGSATLLLVLSPGYLASEWCLREKDSFLEALKGSPLEGSRIFLVERDQVDYGERPPPLDDLLGYRFWVQEGEGQPPQILGVPRPDPSNSRDLRYFDELTRISANLADQLKRLRKQSGTGKSAENQAGESSKSQAEVASDDRPTVFLAEATDDLDDQASALRGALEQAGIRVLPESFYPREPEAYGEKLDQDLARCSVFVQLVGPLGGKRPPTLPQGYVRFQHERALAASLPILQWRSRKLDPSTVEDARQREFIEAETVMAVGMEEFRRTVVERAAAPVQESAATSLEESLVFVDADPDDLELAEKAAELLEAQGLACALPLPGGSPAEVREDLEQNFLAADALIITWGSASPLWVRNQILLLRKLAWKRDNPLSAVALLLGPPEEKPSLRLSFPHLLTLDASSGLDAEALAPFLKALEAKE